MFNTQMSVVYHRLMVESKVAQRRRRSVNPRLVWTLFFIRPGFNRLCSSFIRLQSGGTTGRLGGKEGGSQGREGEITEGSFVSDAPRDEEEIWTWSSCLSWFGSGEKEEKEERRFLSGDISRQDFIFLLSKFVLMSHLSEIIWNFSGVYFY